MKIIVDHREPNMIVEILSKLGVIIETQQLPFGDYILSDQVIIERKRGRDFVQSLYDGRLFNQITQLVEQYEKPILIIEDFQLDIEEYKQVYGALSYLVIFKNIPIIPTSSDTETAYLIERLTSWVQEEHEDPVLSRGGPKRLTNRDKQLYFLQGLDGVGLKTAKYLLDELQSPLEIINLIVDSEILVTKTGKPKGVTGKFAKMRGIGHRFVERNQQLLIQEE
ncbi:MAG: ERCC4 domain-containing protein [Candidatus Kariarchaeaceae archaeon]